jgi:hypothetical protein
VLASYLKQNMRFFVARVNLAEQTRLGFSYLRPLQVAYESPKFMLPIRLGMVNADGSQELFVYALTRTGRIETTNYRTVKIPSDVDLPLFVKDPGEFTAFYKAMFSRQVDGERGRVFVEYAWDTKWCDPCAAEPLSTEELRRLGAFWSDGVFVTRLHVRYDTAHFPEDFVFQETADRENFQGRYVVRHAWTGDPGIPASRTSCPAADAYRLAMGQRHEREAQQLASLTGWDLDLIRRKMNLGSAPPSRSAVKWWEQLWKK